MLTNLGCVLGRQRSVGVVTLTASGRAEADLVTDYTPTLAADLHAAIALRRCRWVTRVEQRERGGAKRLRTSERTVVSRCRLPEIRSLASHVLAGVVADVKVAPRLDNFNKYIGFCRKSGSEARKDQVLVESSRGKQIELLRE